VSATTPQRYVKLSTLAELGEAFALDRAPKRRPKSDRQDRRPAGDPPILVSPDCGLCGKPLLPGRYLCADHARLALEAAEFHRLKHRQPGSGRVWLTDPTTKENLNV
jgi:hypothetical protein